MTSSPATWGPVRVVGRVLGGGGVPAVVGADHGTQLRPRPAAFDQPADGAVPTQAPTQLELTCNADLLPIASMVVLRDADGADVPVAEPAVTGATVTLPRPQQAPAED